jgi:hypothetical protein
MSDYMKSMTDFWTNQGKAMLEAQEKAARTLTENMQSMMSGKPPTAAMVPTDLGAVSAEFAHAGDALMQLWSAAASMSSELGGKLTKYVAGAGGKQDGVSAAVFNRITDPRQWMAGTGELDDVLTRMAEGPRLADLWDLERRYARVIKSWTELRRRTFEHQRLVLDGWLKAGRRYIEELAGRVGADNKPLEPKRAFQVWTEIANRELLALQRSDSFLRSQRELIRTSTELRLAQQELVEHFGKQYGFPTRTELDDVHRSLTEMRREMRRLRRQVADSNAAPKPPVRVAALRVSKRKAIT